jgi:hypothetical protein
MEDLDKLEARYPDNDPIDNDVRALIAELRQMRLQNGELVAALNLAWHSTDKPGDAFEEHSSLKAYLATLPAITLKPFQGPQTLLPDGSAPPGVTWPSFASDPNTGRYRDASGEIQFVKDGVIQKRKCVTGCMDRHFCHAPKLHEGGCHCKLDE